MITARLIARLVRPFSFYVYRSQRPSSAMLGRLPYIRMPTRYIFAAIQTQHSIVATIINIDKTICHSGGLIIAMRIIISVGAKNGTIESAIDEALFGLASTIPNIIIGTITNKVTGSCAC